jgi:SAM-dependent methyltransferase
MIDLRKIPFTYPWILDRAVGDDCKTVLDVGCGEGGLMEAVSKGKGWEITGIDIHGPTIAKARKKKLYKKLYISDLMKFPDELKKKKFDLVFSSQVVEHLKKKDALKLMKQCEKLATKRVMISTTVGFMEFVPLEEVHCGKHDDNPHQKHVSGWEPKEFRELGYTSRGQGLFLIYKQGFLAHKLPRLFHPILFAVSMIFAPFVYFFPNLGTYQVTYKKK